MQQTQGHCMAPNNPIHHLIHWWIYTTSFTMKYYHSKTQGGLTLSIFYVHCKTDHNNNTIEVTHTHNFQKGQNANRNRPGYKCSCYWHDTMVIIIKQVMLIFFFHCIHANKHSTKVLFYSCVLPVWLSPLEYVPLSLYYSYLTLPITHLHTYYYFKKKSKTVIHVTHWLFQQLFLLIDTEGLLLTQLHWCQQVFFHLFKEISPCQGMN